MTAIDCIDEIAIDASVEKVFETVRNYPRRTDSNPRYRCQLINSEVVAEGTEVRHQYGSMLMGLDFVRRIDKIEASSRLEESYVKGPILGKGTWLFSELNGRTTVAFHCQVEGNSWLSNLTFKLSGDKTHKAVYAGF
jgi:hypothetical protein